MIALFWILLCGLMLGAGIALILVGWFADDIKGDRND